MITVSDLLIGVPMSVILFIFVQSITKALTKDSDFDDKVQKMFIFNFVLGVIVIFIATTVFGKNKPMHNKSIQTGLILGGAYLIINTFLFNWTYLEDLTRILLVGMCLALFVWIAYKTKQKKEEKENDNGVKKTKVKVNRVHS